MENKMVEFDSFINVDEIIEAKDSNYVTKELSFDDKTILNTPYKFFNVSKIKLNNLKSSLKGNIVESTKFIIKFVITHYIFPHQ